MTQEVRRRKEGTIDYSANNQEDENLGRGVVYREIALRLTGQLTVAGADNTSANTNNGDEWAVVKRIRLLANGTDVIKDISGNDLWWLDYFLYGTPPKVTPTLGDGSTANPSFDSVLVLPLWMPNAVKPIDTALDARELSSLEVEIQWGDHTSINGSATGFTTTPRVELFSLTSFNVSGPFSQWRLFPIEKEITANNPQFEVELPVGKMYRGFMIRATDGGQDQSDIVNNLKLVSGSTVFADVSVQDDVLPQWENLVKGTSPHWNDNAGSFDDLRRSDDSQLEGVYFYEHVTDGFLTEAIDTLGFSEFKLEMNVSVGAGTTKLNITPLQVIPIRGGNNG